MNDMSRRLRIIFARPLHRVHICAQTDAQHRAGVWGERELVQTPTLNAQGRVLSLDTHTWHDTCSSVRGQNVTEHNVCILAIALRSPALERPFTTLQVRVS